MSGFSGDFKRKLTAYFLTVLLTLTLIFFFGSLDTATAESEPIPEDHLRINIQREAEDYDEVGLWVWEDVATASEDIAAWPEGATWLEDKPRTDFGTYVDVELAEEPEEVGFLLNNKDGDNLTEDKIVEIIDPDLNEIWLKQENDLHEFYLYEPVDLPENTVRIHFQHEEIDDYEDWGLWTWGDVITPTEELDDWPDGAHDFQPDQVTEHGAYIDIEIEEDPDQINFLAVNMETEEQTADINVSEPDHDQYFFRQDDEMAYTNPHYIVEENLQAATLLQDSVKLIFDSTAGMSAEDLDDVAIVDSEGEQYEYEEAEIIHDRAAELRGDFDFAADDEPYQVSWQQDTVTARLNWRLIDDLYAYEGDLGVELHDDGSATLKLWSPRADDVGIVLYDSEDQHEIITDDIAMERNESGVWQVDLDEENTGLEDLTGYYYHYRVEFEGENSLVLDPYAPSMAAWNSEPDPDEPEYPVGKAAIVDPEEIGPELTGADIDNFENREDAVIYEMHIRDFTSDPGIEDELDHQFGTFRAFTEKLDYLEELGVTHVQLMPVMNYVHGNEMENHLREMGYSTRGNNYNWGYDPHSYFALSGMYSENPEDPELRIEEFKHLISEIHERNMGVILDVVYNHTGAVNILEDAMPYYYHFMEADGATKTSYGGGLLGSTREMTERLMLDSVLYWVDEFQVDGFRFDLMGDHDADTMEKIYERASEINPDILMLGEGWEVYEGDALEDVFQEDIMPADQGWMEHTDTIGVFNDDIRDELKSGFPDEGDPRFITGGPREVERIVDNIKAQPHNFTTTDPGDAVQYVASHDDLALHDVIAVSAGLDPDHYQEEIQQRIRLGNTMVMTSQGTAFMHGGQEYGRSKQFRDETDESPYSTHEGLDPEGEPFEYPYFVNDSYDSTDAINMFDWEKTKESDIHRETREFTAGLIELRHSSDAFGLESMELVDEKVKGVDSPDIEEQDLAAAYLASEDEGASYLVIINADTETRSFKLDLDIDLNDAEVLVDEDAAGTEEITDPAGVIIDENEVELSSLTPAVLKLE